MNGGVSGESFHVRLDKKMSSLIIIDYNEIYNLYFYKLIIKV